MWFVIWTNSPVYIFDLEHLLRSEFTFRIDLDGFGAFFIDASWCGLDGDRD